MKKLFFILCLSLAFSISAFAQSCEQRINELTTQRDSLQAMFFAALERLDSLTYSTDQCYKLLKARNSEITKLKVELNNVIKKNNQLEAELKRKKQ